MGEGIHAIMERHTKDRLVALKQCQLTFLHVTPCCRFIVPKEEFMRLNRKSGEPGEILPTKRKYTRRSEVHQPFKVRILPPSQKRGRRST